MARTESTMLPLGTALPEFRLTDVRTGTELSSEDLRGKPAVLVMFICRHCPYVRHVQGELARLADEYLVRGAAIVAIGSNDAEEYPDDAPASLAEQAAEIGFHFPYLYDADQSVARTFRASCTPDFFLFDRAGTLAYRGQLDGSRPRNDVPTDGRDLRAALDAVLDGHPATADQRPSLGCNIKWKKGREPEYFAL